MGNPCDTCRSPGSCCKEFMISGHYDKDTWEEDIKQKFEFHNLPFVPVRAERHHSWGLDDPVIVVASCTKLTPEGRCSIYENRPQLCKNYQPLQDLLCCEYHGPYPTSGCYELTVVVALGSGNGPVV